MALEGFCPRAALTPKAVRHSTSGPMSDLDLARRVLADDVSASKAFFAEYVPRLYGLLAFSSAMTRLRGGGGAGHPGSVPCASSTRFAGEAAPLYLAVQAVRLGRGGSGRAGPWICP